ncbi:MAG: phage tail protein [Syntrophomonadaceae bacterium]|jgi:phage tail-like protein
MDEKLSFLALNKMDDWEKGRSENLLLSEHGITLMYDQKMSLYRTVNHNEMGITEPITNVCSGNLGILYLLDQAANIWVYDIINSQSTLLLKGGHGLFSNRALLATGKDCLFLVEIETPVVVAISATNGQILWINQEFYGRVPLDIAVSNEGDLFIVIARKKMEPSTDIAVNAISTYGVVLKVGADGLSRIFAELPAIDLTGEILPTKRVQAAFGQGKLHVLDISTGQLWIFDIGGNLINSRRLNMFGEIVGMGADNDGFIYIGQAHQDNQQIQDDRTLLQYSPLSSTPGDYVTYRGEVSKLWLDHFNRLYIWNRNTLTISIMERHNKIKLDSSGNPRGIIIFPLLDSTITEMEWHRITLDVDIPDDTQIRLSYFASDSKNLVVKDRLINMEMYLQNKDSALLEVLSTTAPLWSREIVNPQDALLHNARGRYLWIKLELVGSEDRTPFLKGVRVYFPRISLLRYLPAVYQEDEKSKDFLDRFLSIFDTFLQGMEEQIDKIYTIFDPEVASGPFLKWLAGWLGIDVDENWSEDQLRQLLIAAPDLYKKRGTREGMETVIAIFTGEKPYIVEHFEYKYLQETLEIKQLMTQLYGQNPYGFTILVKQEVVPTTAHMVALQNIIDEEKPAFTEAKLVVLQPWIYMDMHSYLGINTYLSELSLLRLDNKASVPFSSVIVNLESDNQLDTHSRIELDARLK